MTESDARRFALEWIEAWNSHDIERILAHYSDQAELTSPFVSRIIGDDQNTVRGKAQLRAYFQRGLETYPDLRFTLCAAYPGVASVIVQYVSVAHLRAAELMRLDGQSTVCEVIAHYMSDGG
jgi:ketosteroid isomerase-like protein